ncbi:hypothetical protein NOK12_39460 [Nocardioides sp. OK12]|nr:hypothetical protein NOK12_39460 [Nocardioides sp. OK12]
MEEQSTKKLNTQNEIDNKQQNTPEPSGNNIATQGYKNVGSQLAKGTPQNREREKLAQAKLLLAKMKLAITRQPNINKEIKQGIPELEDIDSLEFMYKSREKGNKGSRILTRASQSSRANSRTEASAGRE